MKHFSYTPFIWREKGDFNVPFLIVLRSVSSWVFPLVCLIPLLRAEDVIIAPSVYAMRSFLKISDRFKVHVVPHALDLRRIRHAIATTPVNQDKKIIAYMGRLVAEKGIGVLIDCMPSLIKETRNLHLNIIGPLSGEKMDDKYVPYTRKLMRRVRALGLVN
jgi:glycosyltransferase involved in cell wall biosynthesis